MKTQRQMWKEINEPKRERLITRFDKNGKLCFVAEIVDRVPRITRNRRKQK